MNVSPGYASMSFSKRECGFQSVFSVLHNEVLTTFGPCCYFGCILSENEEVNLDTGPPGREWVWAAVIRVVNSNYIVR